MTDEQETKPLTGEEVYDMLFSGCDKLMQTPHNVGDALNAGANVAACIITHTFMACQAAGTGQTMENVMRDFMAQTVFMVNKWAEEHLKPDNAPVN